VCGLCSRVCHLVCAVQSGTMNRGCRSRRWWPRREPAIVRRCGCPVPGA
jgi:hypothetical protein